MARYTHARNSMIMGEVSPRFLGRTDTDQYRQACEYLSNYNVLPMGGVQRRRGTAYQADITSNHAEDYMSQITFFGITKNYIFLISSGAIEMYSAATGALLDNDATGPNFGQHVQYTQRGSYLIITNGVHMPYVILVNETSDTYTFWFWGENELQVQPGTGLVTTLTNQQHRNLPWFPENTAATTLAITSGTAAIGSGKTMTASAATFSAGMVGQYIRVRHTADVGIAVITAYTSTTVVTVDILRTFGSTAATATWSFAQWGPTFGFPRAVAFHQERLYFAGASTFFSAGAFPDRVWGSQLGDFWEFSNPDPAATFTLGDDDGFSVDGYFGEGSLINFLSSGQNLFLGTTTGESFLDEIDENYALGMLNTKIVNQTKKGSYIRKNVRHENRLVFAQKDARRLVELFFDLTEDSYKTSDLNELADHLFSASGVNPKSIRHIAYQSDRKIIWVVTRSFELFSCTRNLENNTIGWSRHTIGGSSPTGTSSAGTVYTEFSTPTVMCVGVCPNLTYGFDEVWIVVGRHINGTDQFFLEKISTTDDDTQDTEDTPAYYLDCSISATDSAKTSWPAIAAHLPSTEVHVVADGIYIGTKTLNGSGNLTLDTAASSVAVGFNYVSRGILTCLEANALFGSGLGQVKRTEEITFLLDRTSSFEFGVTEDDGSVGTLQEIEFREATVAAGDPTPLFSGEKTLKLTASYQRKQRIVFQTQEPLPSTVVGIVMKGLLSD